MSILNAELLSNLSSSEFYFNSGDYETAELLLTKVLKLDPLNSKANELLAYIKGRQGHSEAAHTLLQVACSDINCSAESHYYLACSFLQLKFFDKSIIHFKLSISKGGYFFEGLYNLGIAQVNIGAKEDALDSFSLALKHNNNHKDLHNNIGRLQFDLGYFKESLKSFDAAINLDNNFAMAWFNKGNVLNQLKQYTDAITHYDKVININPQFAMALINKGLVLFSTDHTSDALDCYQRAIEIDPNISKCWSAMGLLFNKLDQPKTALTYFNKAIGLDDKNAETYSNRSLAHNKLLNFTQALVDIDIAISLDPNNALYFTNKGVILYNANCIEDSVLSYEHATLLDPTLIDAWFNKAIALNDNKDFTNSITCFKKAIELNDNFAEAHYNLSFVYFNILDFKNAWEEYQWRWKVKHYSSPLLKTSKPKWDGNKSSRSIFIWSEQGIGDQVLYSSVFYLLTSYPQKIIISLDTKLIPIFERSFPNFIFIDRLISLNENDYDAHISISDLFSLFRGSVFDFMHPDIQYLKCNPLITNNFIDKFVSKRKTVCGLSLLSSNKDIGSFKSIPNHFLNYFKGLTSFQFIDLQNYDSHSDTNGFVNSDLNIFKIEDIDLFNDIDSLASIINACDIIVTCSNSIAHLAGALNKPTLLLLPYSKGKLWYWNLTNGGSSMLYPSVRIFQQKSFNKWDDPIFEVLDFLENFDINSL
jgi:tetratricopeptide (TPR) repeat protein